MSKKSTGEKKKSRWNGGLARYSDAEKRANSKLREQPGWRNGARVYKK